MYSSNNCFIYQGISNICEFSSGYELPLLKLNNRNKMFVPLQYSTNSIFILYWTITEVALASHAITALEFYCSQIIQPGKLWQIPFLELPNNLQFEKSFSCLESVQTPKQIWIPNTLTKGLLSPFHMLVIVLSIEIQCSTR